MAFINGKKVLFSASITGNTNKAVVFNDYDAMITDLNALPGTAYAVGQNIFIITLNVPDLWISSIATESVPYTYVDDATLANEIKTNGSVQIGYYVLSALETQKVDLTEYVKNTDIAQNRGTAGLIRWNSHHGWLMTDDGYLYLQRMGRTQIDARKTYSWLDCSNVDDIVASGLTTNKLTLTDEEKASAQKWLGILANSGGINIEMDWSKPQTSGTISKFGHFVDLYHVSSDTYTRAELIGATVQTLYQYIPDSVGIRTTISESHIIEETADGMCICLSGENAYSCAYIYIAYTTNYMPTSFNRYLPSVGVYFTLCKNTDNPYVNSLKKEGTWCIDNGSLDLANNNVIKALMARIEALENK